MCQHFVSDLIWAVLSTDMVPVVFGKETLVCKHPWNPLFRWSELLKASAKGLLYWCTQPVPKKSCPFSQVKLRLFFKHWQIRPRYLDRSDELYSSYLLWKDSYRVETQVDVMPSFPVPQSLELSGLHSIEQNLLFWAFIGQSWLCELCSSLDPNPDQIALPHAQVHASIFLPIGWKCQ